MRRSTVRSALVALATGTALALTPLAVPTASAAQVDYELGDYWRNNTARHGAVSPESRRIEIGPATTEVVVAPDLILRGPDISCGGDSIEGFFLEDPEWNGSRTVAVVPGAIDGSGDTHTYSCRSGEGEAESIVWTLVEAPDAPQTVVLDSDPTTLVSVQNLRDHQGGEGEPRTLFPGDRITVTGASGEWPTAPDTIDVRIISDESHEAEDVVLAPDGSSLSFTIPALPPSALNQFGNLYLRVGAVTPGGPTTPEVERVARWGAQIYLQGDEKISSTATLALNRHYAFSFSRVTATVTVRVPEGVATGSVTLEVDGRTVDVRDVHAGNPTRVTFTLPKLARGVHTVSSRYGGSPTIEQSQTATERIRILF